MTGNQAPLSIIGDGFTVEITLSAASQKAVLLAASVGITQVRSTEEQSIAQSQLRQLADFRLILEKSREEVKRPVLAVCRMIDQKARDFSADTDAEEKRIKGQLQYFANWQETERRVAEDAARKAAWAAAEERRKAEEAAAAVELEQIGQRAEAAEARRIASLPDTSLRDAADALARQRATQAAADAAAAESSRRAAEAVAEADRRAVLAAQVAAEKPAAVKMMLDYEVLDVHELYAAARWAVELTPKRREILNALETMRAQGDPVVIPGLLVREVAKISTR